MKCRYVFAMAVLAGFTFFSQRSAQAALVSYDFRGTVSSSSMGSWYSSPILYVNEPLSVNLSYDDLELAVISLKYQVGTDGSGLVKNLTYTADSNTFVSEEAGLYATAFTRTPYEVWSLQFGQGGRLFTVRSGNPNSTKFYDITAALNQVVKPPVQSTPVPGALWLFGSGIVGLAGIKLKRNSKFC